MPTTQELLLTALKAAKKAYKESCKLLRDPRALKPTQRLVRQETVKGRLKILNELRERVGKAPKVGPRLLSVDELLQPKVSAATLQAAFDTANQQPGMGWFVARVEDGSNALAA